LTAAICSHVPNAVVTGVVVEPVSAGTQERHRLHVAYNEVGQGAGLPTSIFTKSLPSFVTRMVAGFGGHARVEGGFYRDVRPLLRIEAPTCYYSAYDRTTFGAIHLLEDLSATKGAIFCNYGTKVTRAMAEDQVDLLASLHGRFYGDSTIGKRLRWLADYPRWFTIGVEKMRTQHYTQKALDAAVAVMPASIMRRRQEIWPATIRALAVHREQPGTILHSDVHIGNWYQTRFGRMGLCDWQCPSFGHWSRDFAYAISSSLAPEDRRSWERELLKRYLDRLAEQGIPKIEFGAAFDWYRQQILHAFAMWTITLRHSPFLPSMQSDTTTLTMMNRIATAIDDLGSLDAF
jgi:hypothetical protein